MVTASKKATKTPQPKGKRPKCLQCRRELEPQFKGIRVIKFTGHYGRYGDDLFCGQSCGYNHAVKLVHRSGKKKP